MEPPAIPGRFKPLDLFDLARRHVWLRFLVVTEYGSATYIEVRKPARFEILVSTTGLLVREVSFTPRVRE